MEKLDKVIAGLEFCGEANKSVDACLMMCPYYGERDGDKVCMDFLMEDALTVIEALRAERDDLRKDVAVLTEESEPVVHAHWEFYEDASGEWWDKCSGCGGKIPNEGGYCCDLPRCPHCGAHMDEEVAE